MNARSIRGLRLGALAKSLAAAAIALAPAVASAQPLAGAPMMRQTAYAQSFSRADGMAPTDGATRVDLTASGATSQVLALPRGKSAVVDLPVDARDVLVTNPAVADAVLRSPRRIMVMGVAPGQTDAVFFDAAGRRILSLDIRVDVDSAALNDTIARLVPGSRIRVEAINNSVVLTGEAASASAARPGRAPGSKLCGRSQAGGEHADHRRQGTGDGQGARGRGPAHSNQATRL